MKMRILCSKILFNDGVAGLKSRRGGIRRRVLVSTQFGFGTSASSVVLAESEASEGENWWASPVMQDKELLSKKTSISEKYGSFEDDRNFYSRLLKRCAQLGKLRDGKVVHARIVVSQFRDELVLRNCILNMYAKCGSLVDARKVFDEMRIRDVITWTALITGYSQNEQAQEALALFPQMLRRGLEPNEFTLSSMLKASGDMLIDKNGRQIHGYSLKCGFDSNVYVGSSLVDMYAKYGCMVGAESIFQVLMSKNEVSWNALIAGHCRKGEGERALVLFLKMLREDFKPTHFTYASLFTAFASTGSLEQGKWVHAHVIKSGDRLIAFVGNTLLDMYAKSGSIEDAKRVFNRLVRRDVVSWNSMLKGYAQHGLGKETVQQFEEMLKIGIKPNEITFLCVLNACSHAGMLDQGKHYFDLMKKFEVEPQVSHYVTMVDLLGRAGLLDQAEKFIIEMPIEPAAAVWGALLGACRMHKNMELGAYAAERVFELDPHDSGPHILLYNMYASAGRWTEATKVRRMMKQSGVKKEPACSWVEIENAVHLFMANDTTHPQSEQIHKMWDKMSKMIKEIGYVPDASHVLLFVDQQEREAKLQYHSEKLALAFALLNTPQGSTIRIKKNIRMCGDCHSAIKYVSKVVRREIIVRDTNRFHHFLDGHCSCGDYW
ncbi:hypothetical protein UlMin_016507 [Ulmus minor]